MNGLNIAHQNLRQPRVLLTPLRILSRTVEAVEFSRGDGVSLGELQSLSELLRLKAPTLNSEW